MGAVVFETDKKQNYRELRATAEGRITNRYGVTVRGAPLLLFGLV